MESEEEIPEADIINKFDLPEQKSTIGTIIRKQDKLPVYCICHSTDISRFMICCEKCDEWYHGDCINLAERDSKFIKIWFCDGCIEKYGLEILYYPSKRNSSSVNRKKNKMQKVPYKSEHSKAKNSICGQCSNCLRNEECGNKDYTFTEKRTKYEGKQAYQISNENKKSKSSSKVVKEKRNLSGRQYLSNLEEKYCIGPKCTNWARMNSKYCSDNCGMALARLRILTIIPKHIIEREKIPCVADRLDRAKLDNVRLQKKCVIEELKKLDYKEKRVKNLISRGKQLPVVEMNREEDDEGKTSCLTCGWEIPSRSIGRHMEICFKKLESQYTVVGKYKTNSATCNIFCDHYDSVDKTYCKRLRYVCPDHFKPKPARDNEVCGCPIIKTISHNIFSGAEKFCQQSKKKCDQHCNWENLSLAEIDLERLQKWHKVNELIQEEANILRQLTNRTGALGLLLHNTTVHNSTF